MKHLKAYESMYDNLHIGDYILVHYDENIQFGGHDDIIIDYLNNNIAQILAFDRSDGNYISVNYETKPDKRILVFFEPSVNKKLYKKIVNKNYIIAVGKDKEELEAKLTAKKYNL